ncbi:hypothetical protein [Lentibacillus amyloliquefaciens]|uniref:Uncharacterized protein n=1 Tax=Lentibacillus amyloliquefaciens TaxID=1472767 RepID=A0A0U4F8B7_9BACI|nr:hypothetical protein [Lentibacillus amyloliquefaciens]ALX49846.1 hypothetical protein AOX59_15470 [Lentibacillus amyloliquefaciens]
MRNQYEKYIRMELLLLALGVIVGLTAIVQGSAVMMLLCVLLVAISICFDGLLQFNTNKAAEGIKQFLKAGMLMLLAAILLFFL